MAEIQRSDDEYSGEFVGGSYISKEFADLLRLNAQTPEPEQELAPELVRPPRSRRGLILLGGIGVASAAAGVATKFYRLRHAA